MENNIKFSTCCKDKSSKLKDQDSTLKSHFLQNSTSSDQIAKIYQTLGTRFGMAVLGPGFPQGWHTGDQVYRFPAPHLMMWGFLIPAPQTALRVKKPHHLGRYLPGDLSLRVINQK